MRDFEAWLATMTNTINGYTYYVDFATVYANVPKYKFELNLLNALVGSKQIEQDFDNCVQKYPEVLKCIPIILAERAREIYAQDERGGYWYNFDQPNQTVEQYKYFLRKSGVFELLEGHIISNLMDYVTGVESGLSSNGRKNRGGHQMENLLEKFIKATGYEYQAEMKSAEVERTYDINLSAISNQGKTVKRWDFVVKTPCMVYCMETNFYTSGGSKLNETARSYKMIATEARSVPGMEFVWVTDGGGWNSARNNLRETFEVMDYLYNINDLRQGALQKLFDKC